MTIDRVGPTVLTRDARRRGRSSANPRQRLLHGWDPPHFDEAIRGRIARALRKHPPHDNPYAWRLLLGEELPGHRLPVVDPESIRWVDEPLLDHAERVEPSAYDAVAISNVVDGAEERGVRDVRKAAMRAVVPGGPVITRSFATTMEDEAAKRARRDRAMLRGSIAVAR